MALAFQIIGGLLALFVCFLTYMNTKVWRWPHVTMFFFTIVSMVVFMVYAALVHKTRLEWQKKYAAVEKQYETEKKQLAEATEGVVSTKADGLFALREQVKREIIDRGRVWRGCTPAVNADGTVTLTMPGGAAKKHGIEEKTVVHAFLETPAQSPYGPLAIPVFYLGEFQASGVTDTTVTLASNLPQGAMQLETMKQPANWVLYEIAPADAHEPFEGLTAEQLAPMMPENISGLDPQQYQAMLNEYLRTGQRAEDSDLPDNVYIKVKFKQPHEIVVDAATVVSPLDDSNFDAEGKAQTGRLLRKEDKGTVKFAVDSIGIFDSATATKLIDDGIADKVEPVFRRQLHDYEAELQRIHHRMVDTANRIAAITDAKNTVETAQKSAEAQAIQVEAVRTRLVADKEKLTAERDGVTRYADKLAKQVALVRDQVNKLYRSNKQLTQELAEITTRLTEEINRRSKDATAMASPAL